MVRTYELGMMNGSQVSRPAKFYLRRRMQIIILYMVADLIDHISKSWNWSLISQLFLSFKVERVMSIPLSSLLEDVMCWDLEKYELYYVRLTYKAIWGRFR